MFFDGTALLTLNMYILAKYNVTLVWRNVLILYHPLLNVARAVGNNKTKTCWLRWCIMLCKCDVSVPLLKNIPSLGVILIAHPLENYNKTNTCT